MTSGDASPSTSTYRDAGNVEFRKGNYLKAAALYTRAIKEDPECAALYSNRSAALLHINKVAKALVDAEECIRLDPAWDKGHFRKGAALEALGNLEEALEAYQKAAEYSQGESKQVSEKVRNMQKLVRQQKARKMPFIWSSTSGNGAVEPAPVTPQN